MELFRLWSFLLIGFGLCDDSFPSNCKPSVPLPTSSWVYYTTPLIILGKREVKAPSLPVLPGPYSTKVEITSSYDNLTVSTEEYDETYQGTVLNVLSNGGHYKIIFNHDTDELFYILPDMTCKTKKLTAEDKKMFFINVGLPGGLYLFTIKGALKFAANYKQTYMGKKVIRGINCDHWHTCLTSTQLSLPFTFDYYFTSSEWTPSDGKGPVPVRAEIFGYQTQDGAAPEQFHHVYDYYDYVQQWPGQGIIQTPSFVICPGRKQIKSRPLIGNVFSYRKLPEKYSPINWDRIGYVAYDQPYRLLRVDSQRLIRGFLKAVIEVHDYNTGVRYVVDKTMGSCSVTPIIDTFDVFKGVAFSGNKQHAVMKTTTDFFHIDKELTYSGQRKIRGMDCEVFIRRFTFYPGLSYEHNGTLELYFHKKWAFNNAGKIQKLDNLVQLNFKSDVFWNEVEASYFYDFKQGESDITKFDVSKCFHTATKINFNIVFNGTFNSEWMIFRRKIIFYETTSAVASAASVSPLRISNVQINRRSNTTFLSATLLDKSEFLGKLNSTTYKEISLSTAWQNLIDAVDKRLLQIRITLDRKTATYTAQEISKASNPITSPGKQNPDVSSATATYIAQGISTASNPIFSPGKQTQNVSSGKQYNVVQQLQDEGISIQDNDPHTYNAAVVFCVDAWLKKLFYTFYILCIINICR